MIAGARLGRMAALAAAVAAWSAGAVIAAPPAGAADASCASVRVVFARGSGQPLGHREAPRFLAGVTARLGAVAAATYELGSAAHGGARYPAAGIGTDSAQDLLNVLDAWTGVAGGTYRASVSAGATELAAYPAGRAAACPGERFVVGGYSKGAQAVGDGLVRADAATRARVAYVALFGDPKLHLPEGLRWFPAACRTGARSPWRRGNVGCFTDNGLLGARQPYLPAELVGRTGSWCDRNDPICNNNVADLARSTHGRYSEPGAGMDGAVAEIAAVLGAA